jgi:cell division transport system permease protein
VALASVAAAVAALNGDVGRLAATYGSSFRLGMPAWTDQVAVVGFSAVLGWMGAYLSVSRHLR